MKQVHSKCYSLLQKYLDGGSRKNEMYIARHYDFLVEQLFIEVLLTQKILKYIRSKTCSY